ncbi:MAG: hypothetical protein ACR2OY_13515, partial [Boseongicola sp.]
VSTVPEDEIIIRQLRCDCEAHGRDATSVARERLEQVAKRHLPQVLGQCLEAAIPDDWRGTDTIISILRLDADLDIDVDADPVLIAREWAKALAISLVNAKDQAGVEVFRSSDDRLGAFLTSFMNGTAWSDGRWQDFEGVKALPFERALSTILQRDLDQSLAALATMPGQLRTSIIAKLGRDEAMRMLHALAPDPAQAVSKDRLKACVLTAQDAIRQAPLQVRSSPAQLCLFSLLSDPATRRACINVGATRAAHVLWRISMGSTAEGNASVSIQDQLYAAANALLTKADIDRIEDLLPSMAPRTRPERKQVAAKREFLDVEMVTPFGGVFLVLPHILALPGAITSTDALGIAARALGVSQAVLATDAVAAHVFDAWPDDGRTDPGVETKELATWAKGEGAQDQQWRKIKGTSQIVLVAEPHGYWLQSKPQSSKADHAASDIDPEDWAAVMPEKEPDDVGLAAQIVLRRFAYRIPGFAASSVRYLRDNFLSMEASVQLGADQASVRLGPAPLAVMLNMTGLARQKYEVPSALTVQLSVREDA